MLRQHPNSMVGHTRLFLDQQGTTVHYLAGDQPPMVYDKTAPASFLVEAKDPTPSPRWWRDFVFGR